MDIRTVTYLLDLAVTKDRACEIYFTESHPMSDWQFIPEQETWALLEGNTIEISPKESPAGIVFNASDISVIKWCDNQAAKEFTAKMNEKHGTHRPGQYL